MATADEGSARKTKGAGQRCVSDGHDRLWSNETSASQAAHRSCRRAGRRVRGSKDDETTAAAAGEWDGRRATGAEGSSEAGKRGAEEGEGGLWGQVNRGGISLSNTPLRFAAV